MSEVSLHSEVNALGAQKLDLFRLHLSNWSSLQKLGKDEMKPT